MFKVSSYYFVGFPLELTRHHPMSGNIYIISRSICFHLFQLIFFHNSIQELDILELVEVMEDSEDRWVVQVCLEVVQQTCDANIVRVAVCSWC